MKFIIKFVKRKILIILIIIMFLLLLTVCNKMKEKVKDKVKEHFNENSPRDKSFKLVDYEDKKDKVYVKLNDVMVNEPAIYRNDLLNIKKFTNLSSSSVVLDAGCGTGRGITEIINLFPGIHVEGIDMSRNMINQSRINNPGANLLCTSLVNSNIYKKNSLSHILCMRMTLNENPTGTISKILENFHKWLKNDGYLILNITDPNKLDPGQRAFSQYYKSDNNVKHALTYFEGFTHDAWWEKVKNKKNWYQYCEKIMFSNKNFIIKTTQVWIPSVNKMLEYITRHNYKIKEIIEIDEFNRDDYSMYIFEKK